MLENYSANMQRSTSSEPEIPSKTCPAGQDLTPLTTEGFIRIARQNFYREADVPYWFNDVVQQAIQFGRSQFRREAVEAAKGPHKETEAGWCDTGSDMDWACRSECVEQAIERITNLPE